jgi:hypothetical protein
MRIIPKVVLESQIIGLSSLSEGKINLISVDEWKVNQIANHHQKSTEERKDVVNLL